MADEPPKHWQGFLAYYGHAVFVAHMLEKHLSTLLWFLDARRRAVVRRPSPSELMVMIDEIDGDTLRTLIERLREYQLDARVMELFVRANNCRTDLVHHFTVKYEAETSGDSDFGEAILRVAELREPILEAREEAERLARYEMDRMQADVGREREKRKDPFRFLLDPELNQADDDASRNGD